MGMCLAFRSVSDTNIDKICSSPPLIWRLIAPDEPEMYEECVADQNRSGIFSKIFGKKKGSVGEEMSTLELVEGEGLEDDIDKSWQGLHFCLNQTDYDAKPPMDFLTLGGLEAGDVEVGYGPARLFKSQTVKEIERQISGITREDLNRNYDPKKMEKLDIYPNIWVRDGDEGFDYIADYFDSLKSFVSHCSKYNLGMAIYLC